MDETQILHAGRAVLESVADRLAALLETLPSASTPVSARWTVRDAAAHLICSASLYAELAVGAGAPYPQFSPSAVGEANAARIADIADTDPRTLAKGLTTAVAEFLDATAARRGDTTVCWHGDITLTLAELTGLLVGEQLVHGYDIAAATGIPWSISVDDAALAFVGYRAVLLRTVDPDGARGHTATYRVDLGVAGRLTVRFTDGVVALVPAYRGPVDCEITADPVAMLLVATGRLPQAGAITLGLLWAGGPRPELALGYGRLFRTF